MNDVLSAAQAARVIGCASKKVCERLKRGNWKFGEAIPPKQTGNMQYSYEVNKQALADWLKIPVEEVDRRLKRCEGRVEICFIKFQKRSV